MTDELPDTDVIVVGTGPAGATTALALATYGVRVHAVSRWNWLANTPRAHVINQRANEVFRDLGVEADISAKATPWELIGDTTFTTSLTGPEVARLRTWGTGDHRRSDYLLGSPCPLLDLGQPQLEPILVDAAATRGAQFSFNTEYLDHSEDADGVTVTFRNGIDGHVWSRRARYLIGADGAKSAIAQKIGLKIVGEHARAGQIYAYFRADLSTYVAHRPAVLHYVLNQDTGYGELGLGVLRAVQPWTEWMAGWGFDKSAGDPDLDHNNALQRIRGLVGDPHLDAEIQWVSPWYVNQAYATSYGRGRVFCCGDAVHRHPPSSGLGSNTSVQDAFNLAWKLGYVLKGWAAPSLLDTYTAERGPVGKQIVERANQSRFDYAPLRAALGAVPDGPGLTAGLARIRERSTEGAAARAALVAALDLKSYEFNAQGVELNQRYSSSAVVDDPADGNETWKRDPQLYLQATTRPGAKIPHTWLVNSRGRRVSTLDVTGQGRFSLVTGLTGSAWEDAATTLCVPWLRTVIIGNDECQDLYGDWARLREADEAGALLVRPDGCVAWRHRAAVHNTETALHLLTEALHTILGVDPRHISADHDFAAISGQPHILDTTQVTEGVTS
ncbi:FAD-dependent monooxygenase [Nocardia sp. CA-290969]|uniref:FAD-dependent monooxygenase n=1 Tax=Nocardia sp. CA-290969 TaxID=3239986 RepID=UPI003D8BB04A